MSLQAQLQARVGSFELDVDLSIAPGEVVALLGPNGAGKTSVLRALAGLLTIDAGRIALDGIVLDEPANAIRMPVEQRPIGVVFQDYLLFPHLSVLENVAFGLRSRGVGRTTATARARSWLDRVGLGPAANRKPGSLSGGQAQRVALVRALATDPALLLLDEPMAALDVSTRVELRRELRQHLESFGGVRLLVTITISGGGSLTAVGVTDGDVFAVVHPRTVALYRARPDGTPRNVWEGRATDLDLQGDRVRVRLQGSPSIVAEVTPAAVRELGLDRGDQVWIGVKATEVIVYPA
ncbi:MAG: ATP-binding cassette domain-containing protein [Chloroflexi bacterium]|nr:MAG: ATP-binding cassette domain-containing protein [Chloroflexota bacterium]